VQWVNELVYTYIYNRKATDVQSSIGERLHFSSQFLVKRLSYSSFYSVCSISRGGRKGMKEGGARGLKPPLVCQQGGLSPPDTLPNCTSSNKIEIL